MSPRILIVDDLETNLTTLESVLAPEGYEIHVAKDGPAACEAAARLLPDLVILDVMMPVMDGFAVCRHLRGTPALSSIPVVLLTALNDQASRLEGIRAGADDFISKPFSVEELRARVRTITRLNRYRAIAEQRARFAHLFELSPAAILLVQADGRLAAINARAEELLKPACATAPQPGAVLAALLPVPAAQPLTGLVVATLQESAAARAPLVVRLPAPDGERILNVRSSLLRETEGLLVMLILDDITAEVRAREALEAMNRDLDGLVRARTSQLEEANQLLMSYAVFVSHDLRSPLSVVKGYLSFLDSAAGGQLGDEVKTCIQQAHTAALMMDEMITNILRLAADEHTASRPEDPIDPRPIVERLCWKIAALMPKPAPKITVQTELPPVLASAPLLERVFFNLVSNACKYSARRPDPNVEIGGYESAEGPVLYVRDNGVGFDDRDANRLFRDFSRLPTAGASDGLGLGLALISRLLRAHHGRIWAEGRPGEGATFYVCFGPGDTAPALASAAPAAEAPR